MRPPAALGNEMAVPPRDAFLGRGASSSRVDDAVGRISCESIAGYPPGIPALLPGERITAETVDYLRELVASGARLHGASDPAFRTINVLESGSGTHGARNGQLSAPSSRMARSPTRSRAASDLRPDCRRPRSRSTRARAAGAACAASRCRCPFVPRHAPGLRARRAAAVLAAGLLPAHACR